MLKLYFVGLPIVEKGIEDFSTLSETIQVEFHWYCYKATDQLLKQYPKINFHTGLDDIQLRESIKEMDAFVSCSKVEGFSIPIAEAILMKKCVFAYRLKEVESVYRNNIEYIDCFDLTAYKNRLSHYLAYRDYMVNKEEAELFVKKNYSPEAVSEKLLSVINKI